MKHLLGVAGLYDYGPPGSSLQANIIAEWRRHFIIEEHMLELDTTIMTPAPVFETSGHVARFADWMVKDTKTGDVLRADHLVKNVLETRLAGDKEARGMTSVPPADEKRKKTKAAKKTAVKLDEVVVKEYETVLAKVSCISGLYFFPLLHCQYYPFAKQGLGHACYSAVMNKVTSVACPKAEDLNTPFYSSIGKRIQRLTKTT